MKRVTIKGLNLLPLPVVKPIISTLQRSKVPLFPSFFARHYTIKNHDSLDIPNSNIRLTNDASSISRLLYFLGVEGYEKDEIELLKKNEIEPLKKMK